MLESGRWSGKGRYETMEKEPEDVEWTPDEKGMPCCHILAVSLLSLVSGLI